MAIVIPSYEFSFGHGFLSPRGDVIRKSLWSNGEICKPFQYRFNDLALVRASGRSIPADLADLLDIAAAVLLSDRLAPRSLGNERDPEEDLQSRRIMINLPVREPGRWSSPAAMLALTRLLGYLSHDEFSFRFSRRSSDRPRRSEIQAAFAFDTCGPNPIGVLHSGGLDSFLGLLRAAREQSPRPVVSASVASSVRLLGVQARIVAGLRSFVLRSDGRDSGLLWPYMVLGLMQVSRNREDRESSQRTRGFLYLVTGLVSVALAGGSELWVAENGIGAISLPYTADQVGAQSTRATHPRTLALFMEFVKTTLDRPFRLSNPFVWTTKGEMVRELLSDDRSMELARQTVSCDRVPYLRLGEACGRCTSCLLTRQALLTVGLASVDQSTHRRYLVDVLGREVNHLPGVLTPLYAIRLQAERLRLALDDDAPFEGMVHAFPELTDVLASANHMELQRQDIEQRLVDLYRAYLSQTDRFLALIERPGWGRDASIIGLDEPAVRNAARSA